MWAIPTAVVASNLVLTQAQKERLQYLLIAHSALRFEFGVHDCATVARSVLEIAGRAGFPVWSNEREALALLRTGGLMPICVQYLGDPSPLVRYHAGDLAYTHHEDARFGIILCVYDGMQFLTTKDIGFKRVHRSEILGGWSI